MNLPNEDHPILAQLTTLKSAFDRVQTELHRNAAQLQAQHVQSYHAHDHIQILEHENQVLREELDILRHTPHPDTFPQSHPAVSQMREATLALRKLSDQLTSTQDKLFTRTTELVHAKSDAARAKLAEEKAYEVAARVRGREEAARHREREVEWELRGVREQRRMEDVAVKEYASLVRALEVKMGTRSVQEVEPPHDAKPVDEGLTESLWGLETFMQEVWGEMSGLQKRIDTVQAENEALEAKLEAEVKASTADRLAQSQAQVELDQLKIEDNTATKMVTRYMKFSQAQTDTLQTSITALKTRHAATTDTLSSQIHTLGLQIQTSQTSLARLQTALDDIVGELAKESFGRRTEVALRLRMLSREERVYEALQRWVRRSDESMARVASEEDGERIRALSSAMVHEAKDLLASLDAPHLELSGSQGRLMTAQYMVDQMKAELQQEMCVKMKMRRVILELGGEISEEFLEEDRWMLPDDWMEDVPSKVKHRRRKKIGGGRTSTNGQVDVAPTDFPQAPPVPQPPPAPLEVVSPKAQEATTLLLELEALELEALDVRTSVDEGDDNNPTPLASAALAPVGVLDDSHPTPTILKRFEDALRDETTSVTPPPLTESLGPNMVDESLTPSLSVPLPASPIIIVSDVVEETVVESPKTPVPAPSKVEDALHSPPTPTPAPPLPSSLPTPSISLDPPIETSVPSSPVPETAESSLPVLSVPLPASPTIVISSVVEEALNPLLPLVPALNEVEDAPHSPLAPIPALSVCLDSPKDTPPPSIPVPETVAESLLPPLSVPPGSPTIVISSVVEEWVAQSPKTPVLALSQVEDSPHSLLTLTIKPPVSLDLPKDTSLPPPPAPETVAESSLRPLSAPGFPTIVISSVVEEAVDTSPPPLLSSAPALSEAEDAPRSPLTPTPTTLPTSLQTPSVFLDSPKDTSAPSSSPISVPTTESLPNPVLPQPTQTQTQTQPQPQTERPDHPLLDGLRETKHRYDLLQRSFRDCHLSLQALQHTLSTPPLPGQTPSFLSFPRGSSGGGVGAFNGNGGADGNVAREEREVLQGAVQRLSDYVEDVRVELEMRVGDEEVLRRGYETLLRIPGALGSRESEGRVVSPIPAFFGSLVGKNKRDEEGVEGLEEEVRAFVEGTERGVGEAVSGFGKKLEDVQHDIAVLKVVIHDPDSSSSSLSSSVGGLRSGFARRSGESATGLLYPAPRYPGNARTTLANSATSNTTATTTKTITKSESSSSSWSSWLRNASSPLSSPLPLPPASPTTFGSIMTSPRLRHSPSLTSSSSSTSTAVTTTTTATAPTGARNGNDVLSNLDLRIPMPRFAHVPGGAVGGVLGSTTSTNISPSSSGAQHELGRMVSSNMGTAPPRTRTISSMYMLGLGAGAAAAAGRGGMGSRVGLGVVSAGAVSHVGGARKGSRGYERDIDGDTDLESEAETETDAGTDGGESESESDLE